MTTTTMRKYIRMSNLEYKDADALKRVEDGEGIGKKQTGGNKMRIADIFNSTICYVFFLLLLHHVTKMSRLENWHK